MEFEHIIFDCDGVLVDTEIVAAETMVPVLGTLGHNITVNHYLAKYTGKTFKAIFDMFNIDERVNAEMLIKNIEDKVYNTIRPIKGIEALVQSLDLPKSVVSNSAKDHIENAVSNIGLSDNFEHFFSASQVSNPKPSPEVYEYAAQELSIKPANILVVEDSISGCKAALAAGMNVIGFCAGSHILPSHPKELEEIGVQFVASSSLELKGVIAQLIKKELTFANS